MANDSVSGFLDLGACVAVKVTTKAVLIRVIETAEEAWMPKACMQFGYGLVTGEGFHGFVMRKVWVENVKWRSGEQDAKGSRGNWVPKKLPRLRSLSAS